MIGTNLPTRLVRDVSGSIVVADDGPLIGVPLISEVSGVLKVDGLQMAFTKISTCFPIGQP